MSHQEKIKIESQPAEKEKEEAKKTEEKLFEKYCPEPDWLNKVKLTKEEKEIYERGKGLVREKFIGAVKSGELKLPEREKEIFEKWQKQEGVKKEKEKESWYEKLMKEKVQTYLQLKIPAASESEYLGFKENKERPSGGRVEEYHEWFINNWDKKKSPKFLQKAEKDTLVVAKMGPLLFVEFYKVLGLDKRYIDTRNFRGAIAYQPRREMLEKIWDDLKKNPANAYQLIDPELLKLISLPSNLKIVLEEKEEK